MPAGARTPEELETLLEDAFVLHDPQALAELFQPGAMLVVSGGLPEARGRRQIARVAAQLWDAERSYLADPRRILQARDTAWWWPAAPSTWPAAPTTGHGATRSRSSTSIRQPTGDKP